jgi:hypothetical protein
MYKQSLAGDADDVRFTSLCVGALVEAFPKTALSLVGVPVGISLNGM